MPNLNSGFAVRDVADVVFRALAPTDMGNTHFDKMQPVLEITTATTSSLEGSATTTYAQGGRGNARLVAFDGEKTLTVTLENSILSGKSFAMLSGAGVFETSASEKAIVPVVYDTVAEVDDAGVVKVKLSANDRNGHKVLVDTDHAPYAVSLDSAGGQKQFFPALRSTATPDADNTIGGVFGASDGSVEFIVDAYGEAVKAGDPMRVYLYEVRDSGVSVYTIPADKFAGTYYIEMDTLFKDVETGIDFPAKIIIPRGKIQSNFTLSMAASGDPSASTFTIDCLEGFVQYGVGKTEKVLAAMILDQGNVGAEAHPYNIGAEAGQIHEYTTLTPAPEDKGNQDTNRPSRVKAKASSGDSDLQG